MAQAGKRSDHTDVGLTPVEILRQAEQKAGLGKAMPSLRTGKTNAVPPVLPDLLGNSSDSARGNGVASRLGISDSNGVSGSEPQSVSDVPTGSLGVQYWLKRLARLPVPPNLQPEGVSRVVTREELFAHVIWEAALERQRWASELLVAYTEGRPGTQSDSGRERDEVEGILDKVTKDRLNDLLSAATRDTMNAEPSTRENEDDSSEAKREGHDDSDKEPG